MFGRTPESRDFTIGLVATLAVVGGFFLYAKPSVDEPVAEVAEPQSMQPISATSQIDTSTIPVIATVYECSSVNGLVLSDQPCGDDARIREVLAPNRMDPELDRTGGSQPRPNGRRIATRAQIVPADPSAENSFEACAAIDEQIDRINTRMRMAYTNREGEEFRRRLRQLSDQRWEKCRTRG